MIESRIKMCSDNVRSQKEKKVLPMWLFSESHWRLSTKMRKQILKKRKFQQSGKGGSNTVGMKREYSGQLCGGEIFKKWLCLGARDYIPE